ncbi:helix-turn-helix domain-containing protein [Streptomyces sp. NPDC057235]|uniref:helix-turn-helix domain-containing protein n=1 Tax=Streptomyces sp. NPDC057235 TaxID=3346058 RepID=UPI00363E57C7
MPPRSYPTARQKRLGAELRKLRERAGMSGAQAAAFLGGERAQISHIESGRYGVSDERVRRLAEHYSATNRHLVDALARMAEERSKGWWDDYKGKLSPGFLDVAELEFHAKYLRTIQLLTIPGQFQTEAYARGIVQSRVAEISASEVATRVEHRMRRRIIFDRPTPTPVEAFVHEAALRMRYCDAESMREQLSYLREVTEWEFATVRVVPFDRQITSSVHSMLYAGAEIPELDTVQIDTAFDGAFLDAEAQLVSYRHLLDSIEQVSLDVDESRKFIDRITKEM